MAVSPIEEKILGRLASATEARDPLLSNALYQVLGLSIILSRRLIKARRTRRLDPSRDNSSLKLYHHIIWLAREGLTITEIFILPTTRKGQHGIECQVMSAKLQASFHHIFCLFHNNPPLSAVSPQSNGTGSSPSSTRTPKASNGKGKRSPGKSPKNGRESGERRRRAGSSGLRDPIPSMTSEKSYVTNPWSELPAQTPPPQGPPPPIPPETRRTPTRPPGLAPVDIAASQSAASWLLPPLDYIPMTKGFFEDADRYAMGLFASHALRLSVALEHVAFLWDVQKDRESAVRLARRTINELYHDQHGLDDEEFADASEIVKQLGGFVVRGQRDSVGSPRQANEAQLRTPKQQPASRAPLIDRTIAVSPTNRGARTQSPVQRGAIRSPGRLSVVPEVESTENISSETSQTLVEPPVSRLSSRSRSQTQRRTSSASDKAAKRKAVEQAEDMYRRNSAASIGRGGSRSRAGSSKENSRQATPTEGIVKAMKSRSMSPVQPDVRYDTPQGSVAEQAPRLENKTNPLLSQPFVRDMSVRTAAEDRRDAILKALNIVRSVSRGQYIPEDRRGHKTKAWRMV